MTVEPSQTGQPIDEPAREDFELSDAEWEQLGESEKSDAGESNSEPLRPPSIAWTFRSVAVTALLFLLIGFAIGYVVAKPQPPGEGSVDVGFMQDMIDHHDQAVEMSLYALASDAQGVTKTVAGDVVLSQRQEIGLMDGILGGWNRRRGDPDRTAMVWMGMGVPVAQMFGMQPDERVKALRSATRAEVDRQFLTMLREHHQGGVHMAEYAEEHAQSKRVRELAGFIANTQRLEINEITFTLKQLGLE